MLSAGYTYTSNPLGYAIRFRLNENESKSKDPSWDGWGNGSFLNPADLIRSGKIALTKQ